MRLANVTYRVGSETWLHDIDLSLAPGQLNVLLGATRAGKTTLMRLLAGLDRPSSGRIFAGETDVTGISVRKRSVAMVYQQFINYPSMTVFDNIASPLRIARHSPKQIEMRVGEIAEVLRLTPFLSRFPSELSGGQQQRTALARALARDADLLLLDEPLVNLDYKLREELRSELSRLFAGRATTVVYATTEPLEALQLAGHTALLAEGRVLQCGPTLDVFRRPATLAAARAFSDPPLNVLDASVDRSAGGAQFASGLRSPLPSHAISAAQHGRVKLAIRAHDLALARTSRSQIEITGQVELAEISGSETYVHLRREDASLIAQAPGVHEFDLNASCTLYVEPADWFGFDLQGRLLFAPERSHGAH